MVRLAREDAGEADWLAFAAWLDATPPDRPGLHRQAFDRAQHVWLQADALRTSREVAKPSGIPGRPRSSARSFGWGLAAAFGLAAVLLAMWLRPPRPHTSVAPVQMAVYATAPGERRLVALADGTRVELDGATTLAAGVAQRSVTLVGGEAAFDVVHDPARPFTVALGASRVRVLGTAFDVRRDPGLTEVSVARGLVALDTPGRSVRLPAGRGATLSEGALHVHDIARADVGAWRGGRRIYWDEPLDTVVADLNRAYPRPLRIGDAVARRLRFTGVLALGTREETVQRLTMLLPLQATREPDGAIVLGSSRR